MTNITKAAQDAIDELDDLADLLSRFEAPIDSCVGASMTRATAAANALRAALQDKAGEPVAVAIDNLHNERRDGMTNAIFPPVQIGTRLFAAQPAPVVPDDHPLVVFAKECRLGAYTEREVIQEAGKALAASQQKG